MIDFINCIQEKGFLLSEVVPQDLDRFIRIENMTHYKYVNDFKEFFGEYDETVIVNNFYLRQKMTFFQKIMYQGENVGFFSYNIKNDTIERVYIRIAEKFQNRGIGSLFLTYIKQIADESCVSVEFVAINTNPAIILYKRMGFELFKKDHVFSYFRYEKNK